MMGYILDYCSKKDGFFDGYGAQKKALVTPDGLAEMLRSSKFLVYSAILVNLTEYRASHAPDTYDDLTK